MEYTCSGNQLYCGTGPIFSERILTSSAAPKPILIHNLKKYINYNLLYNILPSCLPEPNLQYKFRSVEQNLCSSVI